MHSTLALLTKDAQIDFGYFARQQAARDDFRRKMMACDPGYLKTWDADRNNQDGLAESANQVEHDWFASVTALYAYASQHSREIEVKSGRIVISNVDVRQTFNHLFERSTALHEKLEAVVQEEVKQQEKARTDVGR